MADISGTPQQDPTPTVITTGDEPTHPPTHAFRVGDAWGSVSCPRQGGKWQLSVYAREVYVTFFLEVEELQALQLACAAALADPAGLDQ